MKKTGEIRDELSSSLREAKAIGSKVGGWDGVEDRRGRDMRGGIVGERERRWK